MQPAEIEALRRDAEEAARRAGTVLRERFLGPRTVAYKGGIDLVTDADQASEEVILAYLRGRHPDHGVLAEESGAGGEGAAFRWIVDPLDGTTNYAHRVPHFCVSVAVEGPGGLLAGAILDPLRGELFSAGAGLGAWLDGVPLQASTADRLEQSLLCTGFPYDVRERPDAPLGLFNRIMRRAQGIRRMGAAALDLAWVAAGRYDGFFEFGLKPWDVAAGALLVREAGGVVSGIRGEPLQLDAGHILACGKGLEAALRTESAAFLDALGWRPRAR
ncbi:MAG: hypothetical protein RL653_1516 [Pseudomonadota bacterium]|jgi:myo-inositol-1(or 4)-monophosphatase